MQRTRPETALNIYNHMRGVLSFFLVRIAIKYAFAARALTFISVVT